MKTQQEIQELAGSLANGNRSHVREELRNALPFELLEFIQTLSLVAPIANNVKDATAINLHAAFCDTKNLLSV